MNEQEIRLRCIEAAAKAPNSHTGGYAAGVLEQAQLWYNWIVDPRPAKDDGKGIGKLL